MSMIENSCSILFGTDKGIIELHRVLFDFLLYFYLIRLITFQIQWKSTNSSERK